MNFINLEDLKSVTWEPPKYSLVTLLGSGFGTVIFDDGKRKLKVNCVEDAGEIVKEIEGIRESVKMVRDCLLNDYILKLSNPFHFFRLLFTLKPAVATLEMRIPLLESKAAIAKV